MADTKLTLDHLDASLTEIWVVLDSYQTIAGNLATDARTRHVKKSLHRLERMLGSSSDKVEALLCMLRKDAA